MGNTQCYGYSTFSALLNKGKKKKLIKNLTPDICHQNRGLLQTVNSSSPGRRPGRPFIQVFKSPPSSVCDDLIALKTPDAHPVKWSAH